MALSPLKVMKQIGQKTASLLIPSRCLLCREEVLSCHSLCSSCWPSLSFITFPLCDVCGLPFDFDVEKKSLCGACHQQAPAFHKARSVFCYDDASKALILPFKHGDRTDLAPAFAGWLKQAGQDLLQEADYLIPVPLHWTRLLKRRYNQAALLSRALSKLCHIPHVPRGLIRLRKTQSQGGLSKTQRFQNVAGAIRVHPSFRQMFEGKKVVLIDDVMTSQATLDQSARALHQAGVHRVEALTIARVVK